MRGKHVSKPIEDLLVEAKSLIKAGTKEIILIAQDSTYYGLDLYKKRALSDLLKRLSDLEGAEWIRLHYAFPTGFPMDALDVMKERDNICNYLDIPLQHGSTKMLQLMRRGITREKTEDLVNRMRDAVPDLAIRTTLIAGHPGEGQAEFEEMLSFVEKMRFDRLGVFPYSHEDDTHSFTMEDDVSDDNKADRVQTIMETQEVISRALNETKVGKSFKVLIDRKEGEYFIGRTEYDSPEVDNEVLIPAEDSYLRIGDFSKVKIIGATEFDLHGELIK